MKQLRGDYTPNDLNIRKHFNPSVKINGITVSEVVELLKPLGVVYQSGQSGSSNIIRSVNVMDDVNLYDWLVGGELVLTTFSGLKNVDMIRKAITKMGMLRVAALAIHPGRNMDIVADKKIYDLAQEYGISILELPREISYSEIITRIMGIILNNQKIVLESAEKLEEYLTNSILSGGGFKGIARSLCRFIKNPVLFLSQFLEVLATGNLSGVSVDNFANDVINEVKSKSIKYVSEYNSKENGILIQGPNVQQYSERYFLSITNVFVGPELYGHIVVLLEQEENEFINIAISRVATAFALEENKRRTVKTIEEKHNISILEKILSGNNLSKETVLSNAEYIGLELNGFHAIMIVEMYYFDFYQCFQHIVKIIKRIINIYEKRSMVVEKDGKVIIFLNISKQNANKPLTEVFNDLSNCILNEVKQKYGDIPLYIGIGDKFVKITEAAISYQQACQSIIIGQKIKPTERIFYFNELGIYSLIISFDSRQFIDTCRNGLEKLLQYDCENNTELTKTLEVYFDCTECISSTARELFIHPNTVKYRLTRIKDIMGKDPFSNVEEKLFYNIALKTIKIL